MPSLNTLPQKYWEDVQEGEKIPLKTIDLNALSLEDFVERLVTDWSGAQTVILQSKLHINRSVDAGDTVTGEGIVTHCRMDAQQRHLIDVELAVHNQEGLCCLAAATVWLPSHDVLSSQKKLL